MSLQPRYTQLIVVLFAMLVGCNTGSPGVTKESGSSIPPGGCNASQGPSPLVDYQWYLFNAGDDKSRAFVPPYNGVVHNHANVIKAHDLATGKGIRVNVIDTDLQMNHEDLCTNAKYSWDYKESDNNPQPLPGSSSGHGTAVAGIIGMRDNGVGGLGVAPGVTLNGHAYISRGISPTFAGYALSIGIQARDGKLTPLNQAEVYNHSYVYTPKDAVALDFLNTSISATGNPETLTELHGKGVSLGRNGKGYIYVKAAGNGFKKNKGKDLCNLGKTSCQNASFDPANVLPQMIVVSATNAIGVLSSYSTTGSAIWVTAPGGEYGYDVVLPDDRDRLPPGEYRFWTGPQNQLGPAMVTTDVLSCSAGYSRAYTYADAANTPRNRFEYDRTGPYTLNPSCNYTAAFNGTSSATPVVSGVAALLLEANPQLTWRDVKHILAVTATQVDRGEKVPIPPPPVQIRNGWTVNAAGHAFNTFYGFGQVDAFAAVKMAKEHSADLWKPFISKKYSANMPPTGIPIPDNNTAGISQTVDVLNDSPSFIEAVRVLISIKGGTSNPGDYTVHLISPMGTIGVLKWSGDTLTKRVDGDYALKNFAMLANNFYGESVYVGNGKPWRVRVFDSIAGGTGDLVSVDIRFFGH